MWAGTLAACLWGLPSPVVPLVGTSTLGVERLRLEHCEDRCVRRPWMTEWKSPNLPHIGKATFTNLNNIIFSDDGTAQEVDPSFNFILNPNSGSPQRTWAWPWGSGPTGAFAGSISELAIPAPRPQQARFLPPAEPYPDVPASDQSPYPTPDT
jgi:hypothetical protein